MEIRHKLNVEDCEFELPFKPEDMEIEIPSPEECEKELDLQKSISLERTIMSQRNQDVFPTKLKEARTTVCLLKQKYKEKTRSKLKIMRQLAWLYGNAETYKMRDMIIKGYAELIFGVLYDDKGNPLPLQYQQARLELTALNMVRQYKGEEEQ